MLFTRDTEDETLKAANVEDNEEEKNKNTPSRSLAYYTFEANFSENKESTSLPYNKLLIQL